MARHAKRRRFVLVARRSTAESVGDRRAPGAAWEHELPQRGFAISPQAKPPDADTVRRLLGAMRRQLLAEQAGRPIHITAESVQQTVDYVLSGHLDTMTDAELGATVLTLRGYLGALADEAESVLDTGRVVVREMVQRTRAVADEEGTPDCAGARRAAATARDLLMLLKLDGWQEGRAEPEEAASA